MSTGGCQALGISPSSGGVMGRRAVEGKDVARMAVHSNWAGTTHFHWYGQLTSKSTWTDCRCVTSFGVTVTQICALTSHAGRLHMGELQLYCQPGNWRISRGGMGEGADWGQNECGGQSEHSQKATCRPVTTQAQQIRPAAVALLPDTLMPVTPESIDFSFFWYFGSNFFGGPTSPTAVQMQRG